MLDMTEQDSKTQCVGFPLRQIVVEDGKSVADESGDPGEKELVEMAVKGDTIAFGQLITRHLRACLGRAMLILRNRDDAEDEVQNACWKAYQHREQFRGEGSFVGWLTRIVENQCLMRIRHQLNAHFLHLDECSEGNVCIELVSQTKDPEDQTGWAEVIAIVRGEVSRIPPLLRQVLLLRDLEQLPMPEVAMRLGISVPAAKSRLMRARVELRTRISKHCGKKGQGTLTQPTTYNKSGYAYARG